MKWFTYCINKYLIYGKMELKDKIDFGAKKPGNPCAYFLQSLLSMRFLKYPHTLFYKQGGQNK